VVVVAADLEILSEIRVVPNRIKSVSSGFLF